MLIDWFFTDFIDFIDRLVDWYIDSLVAWLDRYYVYPYLCRSLYEAAPKKPGTPRLRSAGWLQRPIGGCQLDRTHAWLGAGGEIVERHVELAMAQGLKTMGFPRKMVVVPWTNRDFMRYNGVNDQINGMKWDLACGKLTVCGLETMAPSREMMYRSEKWWFSTAMLVTTRG